jgi:hypothetical protein
MLVFKNNYKQIYPLFKESLELCEFLSFDCEMTGVTYDLKTDATKYDTQQFRYYKMKEIVKKYDLIQVGITFYIRKENEIINQNIEEDNIQTQNPNNSHSPPVATSKKFYIERTFTFFLFKNSKMRFLTELYSHKNEMSIFSSFTHCHPGALKFLNENNFDLNSLISGGIHHNKISYKEKITQALDHHLSEGKIPNSVVFLSKSNEKRLIEVLKSIGKFVIYGIDDINVSEGNQNQLENNQINIDYQINSKKKNASPSKTMKIPNLNPFLINYLLGISLKKLFKIQHFSLIRDKSDKSGCTLILEKSKVHLNTEDFIKHYSSYENFCNVLSFDMILKARYSQYHFTEEEKENLIEEELGFSNFIQLIIDQNSIKPTPIVGHNIFFDLMFIYDKFINDLPENFHNFKTSLHKSFPIIYDNKFLTTRLAKEFDNTKLEKLYTSMKKSKYDVYVEIKPDVVNGFSFYHDLDTGSSFHDAGFDSIITGRCFIYLLKAVENNFETENKKGSQHKIGNEELKNVKGVELRDGFLDFKMRNNLLYNYMNKTILSMMSEPYDICEFMLENETYEDFLVKEEKLIKSVFKHIYVIVLNTSQEYCYHTIYDFARIFENNHFNISVVKIDDHVAFVEFIPVEQNYQSEEEKLQLLKDLLLYTRNEKKVVERIIHYADFAKDYVDIIKF